MEPLTDNEREALEEIGFSEEEMGVVDNAVLRTLIEESDDRRHITVEATTASAEVTRKGG